MQTGNSVYKLYLGKDNHVTHEHVLICEYTKVNWHFPAVTSVEPVQTVSGHDGTNNIKTMIISSLSQSLVTALD